MNYYKRHLGDYARKAGHLTALEHGVYTLMLDAYYEREQPLTLRESLRIARARTDEEQDAVRAVLDEFFAFDSKTDRYIQPRVEEELRKNGRIPISERLRRPTGKAWDAIRNAVFRRDNYACVYCNAQHETLECDHVVPVSRGGTNKVGNLVSACQPCNRSKHNKMLHEWGA